MGQCASVDCSCEFEEEQITAMTAIGNHLESTWRLGMHIPSAGIAVGCILAGEAILYAGYRGLRWWRHRHRQRDLQALEAQREDARRSHDLEIQKVRQDFDRSTQEQLHHHLSDIRSAVALFQRSPPPTTQRPARTSRHHRCHSSTRDDSDVTTRSHLSHSDRRKTRSTTAITHQADVHQTYGYNIDRS